MAIVSSIINIVIVIIISSRSNTLSKFTQKAMPIFERCCQVKSPAQWIEQLMQEV